MMKIRSSACSDTGPSRSENQDRWFADNELGLFVVADGIGGGPHGAVAAEIVIRVLSSLVRRWLKGDLQERENASVSTAIEDRLKSDLSQVSEQLREDSHDVPGLDGMGSTAAVLAVTGDDVVIGHLGDSRVYRLRDGELNQLTVDHSVAQVLISTGELSAEDVANNPACARLTRFVGMPSPALPAAEAHAVQVGDRFLLCTDGVSGAIPVSMLTQLLASEEFPSETADRLVQSAVEHGCKDNATAIVVDVLIDSTDSEPDTGLSSGACEGADDD